MGLIDVSGVSGKAEILGRVRCVELRNGCLTVGDGDVTLEEALGILVALERGALHTVRSAALTARGGDTPDDRRGDAWEPLGPQAPLPQAPPLPVRPAAGDVHVHVAPAEAPAAPPAPVSVQAPPGASVAPPPSVVAPAPAEAPPAPPGEAPASAITLPVEVQRAQTLRPVLIWLCEQYDARQEALTLDGVLKDLGLLAAHIPTVAKIDPAALRERTERTLVGMQRLPG